MNNLLILTLFVLILSSCQSYECRNENGKLTATIKMEREGTFLHPDGVREICDIVRENINY